MSMAAGERAGACFLQQRTSASFVRTQLPSSATLSNLTSFRGLAAGDGKLQENRKKFSGAIHTTVLRTWIYQSDLGLALTAWTVELDILVSMEHGHAASLASAGELTGLLCEFLEVAIHLLLRIRNIYPAEIFERRRHFNVPVQWIRHPGLREYIHSTVTSLCSWIQQGHVKKVAVIFIDSRQIPLEKFVFKVDLDQAFTVALPVNDIEYALRGFFIKLSMSEPLLGPLPADCSFEIVAYSTKLPGDASDKGHFWISTDSQPWQELTKITPIKSMCSDPLSIQLYIEHPSTT